MTVAVDAVVYFRIFDPILSVANVEDVHEATRLLAQTTLRNVLGTKTMTEILSGRDETSHHMQVRYAVVTPCDIRSRIPTETCIFVMGNLTLNVHSSILMVAAGNQCEMNGDVLSFIRRYGMQQRIFDLHISVHFM